MTASNTSVSDLIALPKGGGAIRGVGESFKPDLHTGSGNFSVPIALPAGRNSLTPQLSLAFSTGAGNGPYGLGWSLGIPGVTRRTEKGVPRYGPNDIFVLSGAEELVEVGRDEAAGVSRYRPRTEGLFARITHHTSGTDHWMVETKDGLASIYGSPGAAATTSSIPDARAVIAHPDNRARVFAWRLTETRDPLGNRILYEYRRDADSTNGHASEQNYLRRIRYTDLPERGSDAFLVSVHFLYDDEPAPAGIAPEVAPRLRPDPFSECRAGFEIRSRRRCKWIVVSTHPQADRIVPVRAYELIYLDEQLAAGQGSPEAPPNGASLLARINVIGFDDLGIAHREMPPLDFGYSRFMPQRQRFAALRGRELPRTSLANPDLELVDLFGNGLPDIVEMGAAGVRFWRNLGEGRFDRPRPFDAAPAAWRLGDPGVQLVDANGDGRADLLVTTGEMAGYWPLDFRGHFSAKSFRRYPVAPSFSLEDPDVRLLDLTGDGVTDVLRSGTSFECYFNDPIGGFAPERSARIPRGRPEDFPDVSFADPRVKLTDLNGDGLQDIALVHQSRIDYWPSLGHGRFGRRISMPLPEGEDGLPFQFDPARVLFGDVDGDGLADLLYVTDRFVILWINRAGNGWSAPIRVQGTPAVDSLVTVRLADLLGTGVAGLLWTRDAGGDGTPRHYFLDFTGGSKPYLLTRVENHLGAVTEVAYAPSTRFYLRDERSAETRWRTTLPFPVQVVERVTVVDEISKGTFTTEYRYRHGYWDGVEREFRGFGMVEQLDTEIFGGDQRHALAGDSSVMERLRAQQSHAPPMLGRTWFHQGPVDPPDDGHWKAPAPQDEYWAEDPPLLDSLWQIGAVVDAVPAGARREALRPLRGSVLRSETYALDGSALQDRPYSVTEHAYGLTELDPPAANSARRRIFFPHALAQRTTQWERGDDPHTQFKITVDHDLFGQSRRQVAVACPRGWRSLTDAPAEPYLATLSTTTYAVAPAVGPFMADRVVRSRAYELTGTARQTLAGLIRTTENEGSTKRLITETLTYYDGPAFEGEAFGVLGVYGIPVRSEALVLTEDIASAAYGTTWPQWLHATPPFSGGSDYPQAFVDALPGLGGYERHPCDATRSGGWYMLASRSLYDFQVQGAPLPPRGLLLGVRDPLGHETRIAYTLQFLPSETAGPTGLVTRAEYNPRVLQPSLVTDANGNRTEARYSPGGLVTDSFVRGKPGQAQGDVDLPSACLRYDLRAFYLRGQPVCTRAIRRLRHDSDPDDGGETHELREYSDGFGRLLQTRAQGEAVRFGDSRFGGAVLPVDQAIDSGRSLLGLRNTDTSLPNVVVSGWQVYDNKGRVVERYEPFLDTGWDYQPPADGALGQKVRMSYDAPGRLVRTLHPDGSEQRVTHGIPHDLADPPLSPLDSGKFRPSPWEVYTYDSNDNAGRTHAGVSPHESYRHHHDTPASTELDALGRSVRAVARQRAPPGINGEVAPVEEHVTRSAYDIQGNLTAIRDALGRLAFEYVFDLAGRVLHSRSIDAGSKRVAFDAAGNAVEARDAKGALKLNAFDVLNRPTRMWARDAQAQALGLRQRLTYGDDPAFAAEAANTNRLGKLVAHDDEAGRVAIACYDFKGNVLESSRRVLSDDFLLASYRSELARPEAERSWTLQAPRIDWEDAAAQAALTPAYATRSAYDALNRAVWSDYPEAANGERYRLCPGYNRAGALESVSLLGPLDAGGRGPARTCVRRIAYDAKGQRTLIAYGNGLVTRYAHDPLTFRLARMRTERYAADAGEGLAHTFQGAALQDVAYRYDLAGNILGMQDVTPGCGVSNNADAVLHAGALRQRLSDGDALIRRFEYDPLYRLTSATGREAIHIANPRPWGDLPREGYNGGGHGTPDQGNAPMLTALYREAYEYDAAGNMLGLRHERRTPAASGWQTEWTRRFGMDGLDADAWRGEIAQHLTGDWSDPPSNRLTHVEDRAGGPGASSISARTHWYDANGNMVRENLERQFEWDHADQLKSFRNQIGTGRPTTYALYLYDASGMRVKKLVANGGGGYRTTTYLGEGFEHHTEQNLNGSSRVENCSLQLLDGRRRIAVLRVGPAFAGDGASGHEVQYCLGDHLGSSSVVVSGNGDWINREEFFPYGETSFGGYGRKRYRFASKERDCESGLLHVGARYLSVHLSRWTTADPIGAGDGTNGYEYVHGQPLSRVDPSGTAASDNVTCAPYSKVGGDHVRQVASGTDGPGAARNTAANYTDGLANETTSPDYNDLAGQRVESGMNDAAWGKDVSINTGVKGARTTISSSGATDVGSTKAAQPSAWFEALKSHVKQVEAGLSVKESVARVMQSDNQLVNSPPKRVPQPSSTLSSRSLADGQELSPEMPVSEVMGSLRDPPAPPAARPPMVRPAGGGKPYQVVVNSGRAQGNPGTPVESPALPAGGTALATGATVTMVNVLMLYDFWNFFRHGVLGGVAIQPEKLPVGTPAQDFRTGELFIKAEDGSFKRMNEFI